MDDVGRQPSAFLWGLPPPPPEPAAFIPRSGAWWNQYLMNLLESGRMGEAALRELGRSSREIVGLLPDPQRWASRPTPYKGIVVGAVQSGKTSSMIGVAATAMDHGYRIVVVLAGQKDDLRTQTAFRFNKQLLRQNDRVPGTNGGTTIGGPPGRGPLGGFAPAYNLDSHQFGPLLVKMSAALQDRQPCVLVVKKNPVSLNKVRNGLLGCYEELGVGSLPTLVIDDEADEASVGIWEDVAIPDAVASLWHFESLAPNIAYVGYTATPAANLLQDPKEPLYPSHFAYLLRSPGPEDNLLQYLEPVSDSWYTGGGCFYRDFGEEPGEESNFLCSTMVDEQDPPVGGPSPSLIDALRAYFVSGAYRLALAPERDFSNPLMLPSPHSMLVHTSQSMRDHREWAGRIQEFLGRRDADGHSIAFDPAKVEEDLATHEEAWERWYTRFMRSRERIYDTRAHQAPHRHITWHQVRAKLHTVFENSRAKVVNSDPGIGGSLDFQPVRTADGRILPPPDLYVIAIGGAKLSRGITIEGLCVSYFARWAPTEDTIHQMSRWFGYRGPHLEFCRLMTSPPVYDHLTGLHENDESLRAQLAELMAQKKSPAEARLVLSANPRSLPTAKLGTAELVDLSFSPFDGVLPHIECGSFEERDQEIASDMVRQIKARGSEEVRTENGLLRGIVSRAWTPLEVADLLDKMQYTHHNPDRASNLLAEYYRNPDNSRAICKVFAAWEDPYQVAAYLRYWSRKNDTDFPIPKFSVGVSHGEISKDSAPFDFPLLNRQISGQRRLLGGWTGRSAHWRGDAYFDNPPVGLRSHVSQGRLRGSDGLMLLYIVHKDATGRTRGGIKRRFHSPAFGVSIPDGGPPFRRFVKPGEGESHA